MSPIVSGAGSPSYPGLKNCWLFVCVFYPEKKAKSSFGKTQTHCTARTWRRLVGINHSCVTVGNWDWTSAAWCLVSVEEYFELCFTRSSPLLATRASLPCILISFICCYKSSSLFAKGRSTYYITLSRGRGLTICYMCYIREGDVFANVI